MTSVDLKLPVVALVGRPNVGKSTLFNRIAGKRVAIVLDTPGVTRDRHYLEVEWGRMRFTLVDTGGVDLAEETGQLDHEVGEQSLKTLAEADVVLFITDAREGITPADREIADRLRKSGVAVAHLANKADSEAVSHDALGDSQIGFEPFIPVSAEHGRGLDELYDLLRERLPEWETPPEETEQEPDTATRVAVVGRPNTGKSTLINRLLGEERLVVSNVPGTTRDAIDSEVTFKEQPYLFIDTAGIRRRGKITRGVERAMLTRTMEALKRAEVAVLLMDASEGVTEQDTKIAGLVLNSHRACVLGINKWDLHKGDDEARQGALSEISRHFPFLVHAPTVFLSGQTGFHLTQLFTAVDKVGAGFRLRIGTGELNRTIEGLIQRQAPPNHKHRAVRIYYATQVGAAPPRFVLFVNMPDGITDSYKRYLENGLREAFGFQGVPLHIAVRHRDKEKREVSRRSVSSRRGKPARR
ncbi:MAG: ribosome biogenesis GTPase Der [Nitrospirota bacterium]|nr:ribosome biogenesis GTPase Der [Nitrospirota bacterium]